MAWLQVGEMLERLRREDMQYCQRKYDGRGELHAFPNLRVADNAVRSGLGITWVTPATRARLTSWWLTPSTKAMRSAGMRSRRSRNLSRPGHGGSTLSVTSSRQSLFRRARLAW